MREIAGHACNAPVLDGVQTRCGLGARAFDLTLTLLILPFAVAAAALVAIAVVLDSHGPVLFRSARVGRDGHLFWMVKFRTMRHQAGGATVSSRNDSRYTPVGRLLAASRLDELPQLWNVLRGQMRLVGPRPEVEQFVLDEAESYRRILAVPPGITGPTQLEFADEGRLLAGVSDPERFYRRELLPTKVRSDMQYVTKGSRIEDCTLLIRTWTVPFVQLGRSLAGPSPHPRTRFASLLARTAPLAAASMTMVALFAVEGASAQTSAAPTSDPGATSPAGSIYALPLDAARRDAAPRGRPGRREPRAQKGSPRGAGMGRRVLPEGTLSIRSENNFGSSSKIPGVDSSTPAMSSNAGPETGEGQDADGGGMSTLSEKSGDAVQAAFAPPPDEGEEGTGSSPMMTLFLLGLLLGVGIAVGTLAGRARRH